MELARRGGSRYMSSQGLRLPPFAPQLIARSLDSSFNSRAMDQREDLTPESLPDDESGLRRMMAAAAGAAYVALPSLEEAKQLPDAVVILEGDDGGQIYAVLPAADVHCSESVLKDLLHDLDAIEWKDPSMAHVYFERRPLGSGVAGGMGGAEVQAGLWVHPRLKHLEGRIAAVVRGERDHL